MTSLSRDGEALSSQPFGLFLGLAGFQTLPLPPALIQFLSPHAFQLYQRSLPGWPEESPFGTLLNSQPSPARLPQVLPTPDQVRQGTQVPFGNPNSAGSTPSSPRTGGLFSSWRTLSVAAPLSHVDLLKFLTYGALFFLVLLYPFGPMEPARSTMPVERQRAETKFYRSFLILLLACGFVVALVGVVQLFAGNGKILWLFLPYDWEGEAAKHLTRASGPFINPNHFANYLALILPFALAFALRPHN